MRLVLALLLSLSPPAAAQPARVPRAACAPLERLRPELRAKAAALLTRMLDTEALYTVAGGLKPVSDGFWQARFPAALSTAPAIEEARACLAAVRCGDELAAGVYVFARPVKGEKVATAFVAHRAALRRTIEKHSAVFGPLGVLPDTEPQGMMERVDRGPASARWRAFGLLFGYPEHAVDFFVRAGEAQRSSGKFVERDFVSVPTVARATGRFVYAVPKGHGENDADRELKVRAVPIFAEYQRLRQHYIGEGKPGVAYLLRDWFDDGTGRCSTTRERVAFPVVLSPPCHPIECSRWGFSTWRRCGH
jgi:hypothetical protein